MTNGGDPVNNQTGSSASPGTTGGIHSATRGVGNTGMGGMSGNKSNGMGTNSMKPNGTGSGSATPTGNGVSTQ